MLFHVLFLLKYSIFALNSGQSNFFLSFYFKQMFGNNKTKSFPRFGKSNNNTIECSLHGLRKRWISFTWTSWQPSAPGARALLPAIPVCLVR